MRKTGFLILKYVYKQHPMTVKRWIFIAILIIGLTACEGSPEIPDVRIGSLSQTWIDAPLPHSTIPLLPYELTFHGASPSGIAELEVLINGESTKNVLPSSTDMSGALFFGEFLL